MARHSVALLPAVIATALACVLALAMSAPAGEIGAELDVARGVRWERFDPKTGKKAWEVAAKEATAGPNMSYFIKEPKVVIHCTGYDMNISSDTGLVKREDDKNNVFTLDGNVTLKFNDPSHSVITTEKLVWLASKRLLTTDDPVQMSRDDLEVSGVGMQVEPEKQGKDVRLVRLEKGVKAVISPSASKSALFSSLNGIEEPAAKPGQPEGPPMIITSRGPMIINRDSGSVAFSDSVAVRRGTFSLRCDNMEMTFDGETRKAKDILCTGHVQAFDGKNGASGERLKWDPVSGLTEITGKKDGSRAKTWRGGATVSAPSISISQKDRKVTWSGRAQLFAPPEGPEQFLHFGGGLD